MIYFTSDLHLGHKNIIKLCHRPFASLEEMDETLVSNWNQVVTNGDTVYIIGDLMFRTQNHPTDVLRRLRGKKNLILGNHDRSWLNKIEAADFFKSVESYSEISDGKRKLALCHYPMMSWGGTGKGSYLIHGHIHNNRDAAYWPLLAFMDHALNASVEINQYQPVTFDRLVENNDLFKKAVVKDSLITAAGEEHIRGTYYMILLLTGWHFSNRSNKRADLICGKSLILQRLLLLENE